MIVMVRMMNFNDEHDNLIHVKISAQTIHDHDDEHHSHDDVKKHHNNDNAPDADDSHEPAVMVLDIVMTMAIMTIHTMMSVLLKVLQ